MIAGWTEHLACAHCGRWWADYDALYVGTTLEGYRVTHQCGHVRRVHCRLCPCGRVLESAVELMPIGRDGLVEPACEACGSRLERVATDTLERPTLCAACQAAEKEMAA